VSTQLEELKELGDGIKSTFEEWKKVDAERAEEIKKFGEATAETQQKFTALDDRIDELDVRMQKSRLDGGRGELDLDQPQVKAFEKLIRFGPVGMTEDEMKHVTLATKQGDELYTKTMTVGDDTTGGFLAPVEIVNELIKGIVLFSPIRNVANVRQTSFNSIKAPKRTQTSSAVWVGEIDSRSETQNVKFGKEEISTRELSAMADISRQDLQDAAVNLDQLVYADFEEQFGVSEGLAFVSGDGVDGKPEGILTASDQGFLGSNGIETVASGAATAISGDDLIELFYRLKDGYARNASWLMKRGTVKVVRQLKETSTDNYLWQPGLASVAPPTILDRPYVETVDMPGPSSGATFTTGDLPIAFGDFKRGYWIVDRLALQTLRDPYTQAGNGYLRIWAYKRVGGQVVLPEAIKLLRVA
jgi:HK97 family phage major capsid protein